MRLAQLPAPGLVQCFWHGNGLRSALADQRGVRLLTQTAPRAVMAHAGPSSLLDPWRPRVRGDRAARTNADDLPALDVFAQSVRALDPAAAVWAGVGMDGVAAKLLKGEWDIDRAIGRCLEVAVACVRARIEALMYNPEAGWKVVEGSPEWRLLTTFIHDLLQETREVAPTLVLLHTAYDHALYHPQDRNPNRPDDPGVYPWSSWCGEDGVDGEFPQVYAGDGDEDPRTFTAYKGAVGRYDRHTEQFQVATRRGWFRADLGVVNGVPGENLGTYLQTHSVSVSGTVALGTRRRWTAGWATPTRLDPNGVSAWRALDHLHVGGYAAQHGASAAAAYQREALGAGRYNGGVDNVCGPVTVASMGLAP